MKAQSKISINTPCSEKWEEMIPMERGKLCLRCDRLITDFTNKSDQDILDHIKASNGNICGRFKDEQLNRNLVQQVNPKIIPLWQKVAASLLLFVGMENAQAGKFNAKIFNYDYAISKTDTDKNISKERINKGDHVKDSIVVKGKVIDGHTHEGLPFATVRLIGTKKVKNTDFDGNFELVVNPLQNQFDYYIQIDLIGYKSDTFSININERNELLLTSKFQLEVDSINYVTMGIMVTSEYIVPPKKWWQFWK